MPSLRKIEAYIVNNYFIILFLAYALNFVGSFRPAVILIAVNILLITLRMLTRKRRINSNPVLAFCIYLCISLPFSCILNSFSQAINSFLFILTPCILFFSMNNDDVDVDHIVVSFIVASVINEVVGTVCFYTKPGFFVDFVYRTNEPAYQQLMHHAGLGRLITMFGSIETAQFACITIILCLRYVSSKNKFRFISIIALIISGVVLVLTQQRGPLFGLVSGIALVYLTRYRAQVIKPWVVFLFVVIFSGAMYGLYLYVPTVYEWMIERITNPNAAIESRFDYQWNVLLTRLNAIEWIFGKGVGAFGFFVEDISITNRIFDQMYFNIIGEEGIVGLIIFLSLFVKCFVRMKKDFVNLFIPIFVMFEILFTGLGTTLIYYPLIMPLFWLSAGLIWYDKPIPLSDNRAQSLV